MAQDARLNVYATQLPPLSYVEAGQARGFYIELMAQVAQLAGVHLAWQFQPWARTQLSTQQDEHGLIVNFTRNEEREPKYQWLEPLSWGRYALFTLRERALPDLASLRGARIGYLNGSDAGQILSAHGLLNSDAGPSNDVNVRKLKIGRIDAWMANIWTGPSIFQAAGFSPAELRAVRIGATWQQWLAASPRLNPALAARLTRAVQELRASGAIDALERKYWQIDPAFGSARDWRDAPKDE